MKSQQQTTYQKHRITIRPPILRPQITNIGYGNPRYNSMIIYKDNLLVPCGSSLRLVNLKTNQILMNKQIGFSQIFQIAENSKYVLVVNFQGLLTFLDKDTLEVKYQVYTPGKEIRHISFTDHRLVVSCQLSECQHLTKLCVYRISQIQLNIHQPTYLLEGHFYYPQQIYSNNNLIVIQYNDPNPKGRSRTQTVMIQKLPIKHRIVRFTQVEGKLQEQVLSEIGQKGQIICAASNGHLTFYLHPGRRLTIFDNNSNLIITQTLPCKSTPIMMQPYKSGIIYSSTTNQLAYTSFNSQTKCLTHQSIVIKSLGIGGNLSIKCLPQNKGFYLFNENGLHHYCGLQNKTYTQGQFQITNCGLSMNQDGSMVAVGDFAGNVVILQTSHKQFLPKPVLKVNVGMPVRSIVWCTKQNILLIGCVGGSLFAWNLEDAQPTFLDQSDHSINILRYAHGKIFIGNSDGVVKILDQKTLGQVYSYKAHHPINYQTEKQRQLFGSMKNYSQIWSLTIAPSLSSTNELIIVSSSQDQSEKIFKISNNSCHQQTHNLTGHQLAVTSIDWKLMSAPLGQIYVSCSDDKTIRFRSPTSNFSILFQLQTNTIKQWHTLTYLALEQNGTRVAIGSQNGYLFVFDLLKKEFVFGEKIHLGGIEGLEWRNGKLCTCSSDLCVSVVQFGNM